LSHEASSFATFMNQADSKTIAGPDGNQTTRSQLGKIARRQWRLWVSAAIIALLLTAGLVSFAFSIPQAKGDILYLLNLPRAVYGLLGLVLLFDIYVGYQQLQIHRMHVQLYEQQELFCIIGENAADMIAVVDTSGRRLYNSPSYQKTLGYSGQELGNTAAFEQIHPDDRQFVKEAAEVAQRTGLGRKLEYRFRHKNGSWRILESAASVIRNDHGKPEKFVIVNRDITDRREAEKILRETQARQAQKMEAVGRLSGGIAHDFNNLLGIIIGYTEVMETHVSPRDPLQKSVQEIKKAGERAASLIRQLLAFSRQQVLEPKVLDLNATVAAFENLVGRAIGEHIELTTVLEPKLGRVMADQGQIEQVIMNLAANARDAMPNGGKLTIETTNTELDATILHDRPYVRPGSYVQLAFVDTGTGMDSETQAHIFEPFFTTKERGKGTGLGLATVYGVVKQSNGYIWVSSKLGKGTTFQICLPLVETTVQGESVERRQHRSWQGGETILLVEDEESLRAVTRDVLLQSGFEVFEADGGRQALESAQRHRGPIHLLLTDVVMPGLNGRALAEELAASHPEMKVLYMSGYTDYAVGRDGVLEPGIHLLGKPYTRATLLRKIRAVLDLDRVTNCS
jgi:two-component system cell cycle sensor histidine kinase/response regulator CckA